MFANIYNWFNGSGEKQNNVEKLLWRWQQRQQGHILIRKAKLNTRQVVWKMIF